MVLHTRSVQVAASSDRVYLLLSDVRLLPRYFPPVTEVRADSREVVGLTVGSDAVPAVVELDRDGPGTRIEWVVRDTTYTGIVKVSDGPSDIDSIVTVSVDDGEHRKDAEFEREGGVQEIGRFGGSHGREELPVDALTGDHDKRMPMGEVLERALDHLCAFIETHHV
ncbi:SRPBCC family protein [Streptomyces sp. SID3343]|uniref:SRPBCC family protein n=1 Tax=Streptomyces sp. SID3343 TaxID=2690260 RepID=UPI00136D1DA6|nr:SRPBCC family protein [Streptomyces sp. SID3343]MYW03020.1 hypothetical protein [Streptomyces sp. SID3343]